MNHSRTATECVECPSDERKQTTVWRHRPNKTRWRTLDGGYEITLDSDGRYEVLVPRNESSQCTKSRPAWYGPVTRLLASAYHQCKLQLAHLCPSRVRFSMVCEAVLHESVSGRGFGLSVVCFRSDSAAIGRRADNAVGATSKPTLIPAGESRVKKYLTNKRHFVNIETRLHFCEIPSSEIVSKHDLRNVKSLVVS